MGQFEDSPERKPGKSCGKKQKSVAEGFTLQDGAQSVGREVTVMVLPKAVLAVPLQTASLGIAKGPGHCHQDEASVCTAGGFRGEGP